MEGKKHQNPSKYLKLCLINSLWLCLSFFLQLRDVSSQSCDSKSSCLPSDSWQHSIKKANPGFNITFNGSLIATPAPEALKVYCTATTPDLIIPGEEKKIWCCFSGWPRPRLVHWYKNGEEIVNGSQRIYQYQSSKGKCLKSTLHLPPGREELDGVYECSASNQGSRNVSEKLQLNYQCPVNILQRPTISKSKLKFSTFKLTCRYGKNDDCPHHIWWYREGTEREPLVNSAKHKIVKKQAEKKCERLSILSILNVTENDEGNYSCSWFCEHQDILTSFIYLKLLPPEETDPPTGNTTIRNQTTEFRVQPSFRSPPGGRKKWLLPGIILTAGTLAVIIMSLVRFLVKKKCSSTFKLEKQGWKETATLNRLFISFSSKDLAWINENLISIFEKHSIAYSIHSRDFELGKPIVQNMADNVYGSRQVLIVLSQNYLASNFCREELHMAVQRGIDSGDSSLILVIINNLKKKQLPTAVRNKKMLDFDKHEKRQDWEEKILSQIVLGKGEASDSYTSKV
ncbi:uncharacterized protein LOC111328530 isoform X2 [Stylophora pistillata]|uniref:uncharacterized protein LOC111328530 isoform X2 n=1 Tax=Stylophora pistillata TaxID=50429 RepID=UPI000C039717|nr:uncharacterized protein LOC111328530 isoform X2 [Stylophora pistillata]